MKLNKNGQTLMEYSLIIVIIVAALLSTQVYIKRGIQGKWKQSIDDFGEQYDPKTANTNVRHAVRSTTDTVIDIEKVYDDNKRIMSVTTFRTDTSNSTDFRTGTVGVGAY